MNQGQPERTSPQGMAGLSHQEARALLARHGLNALPAPPGPSVARRLARQFQSPLIYLLLFALAVDMSGWLLQGAGHLPLESLAIAFILLFNAGLGLYQEGRAEQALARLRALAAPRAWALRDGRLAHLPADQLVPGDVLRLEAGDRVPADGVHEDAAGVAVDESLLTGESLPVEKAAGDELRSGTLLVRGLSWMRVTRTGPESAMGLLAALLQQVQAVPTPLERRLEAFAGRVVRWVLALATGVCVAGLLVEGLSHLGRVLLFAVALAVAAVPEGLPAVLTLTLSLGVERMARRRAVVRRLPAVEALGSVTVIASDKTGTITQNRLEVRALEVVDQARAWQVMALANDAEEDVVDAGDPMDRALNAYLRAQGQDPGALRQAHPRREGVDFDSVRRFMRVTTEGPEGEESHLKGAPEVLLGRSALPDDERARWLARAEQQAAEGHKVLGLAWRPGVGDEELRWLGLVSLWDPPRPEVPEAMRQALAAGIRVVMITGDHPATALAIARQVGLPAERAVQGADLERLPPEELDAVIAGASVFARVTPADKLRLVEALQRRGDIVAMTGDGVNDAPALKRADVGVVMGQRGSDVAREAGDVILLDDDFATIVAAIEEGRGIYANIQKFIRTLFATNLSELLVVVLGTAGAVWMALETHEGTLMLPLTASMILWINLITETPRGIALGLDRNPDVMERPPLDPAAPLLDRRSLVYILAVGGLLALTSLALLVLVPAWGHPREVARTLAFHVLVVGKLLCTYPARRVQGRAERNPVMDLTILGTVALQVGVAFTPALHSFLGLTPLSLDLALVGVVAAGICALLVEATTWLVWRPRAVGGRAAG